MKLIYCYINRFRNITNQEVTFCHDYKVSFADGSLSIKLRGHHEAVDYLYGDSLLRNLSVIVGRTGSGKTNLLQLIGMDGYQRYDSDNDGSYLLLYHKKSNIFLVEFANMAIKGVDDSNFEMKKDLGLMEILVNLGTGELLHVKRDVTVSPQELCIINAFDRNSFADCPYMDIKEDSTGDMSGLITRRKGEFNRASVSMECRLLKDYVSKFPAGSIKHKVAFEINRLNWQDKNGAAIGDDLEEKVYWTYDDRKYTASSENAKEVSPYNSQTIYEKHTTPKKRFIHDLMMDYAIYLRKWVEGIREDYNYELSADCGKKSVVKRIDELCQFIDIQLSDDGYRNGILWQIGDDIKDIHNLLMKMDEKYFTDEKFSIPVDDIDPSSGTTMGELFERMEQYIPDEYGVFDKELLPYHWAYISSGEYQYAKAMGLLEEYGVHMKLMTGQDYRNAVMPNIILLMDEPETYMHPELCRQFVSHLSQIVNRRPRGSQIQMIVSTHSPFILSDLLSEQIIKMDYDEMGHCHICSDIEKPYFAANIHTIIADGFFLDYSIGEQARMFLQGKFDYLKRLAAKKGRLSGEERAEVARMKRFLPFIGDEMIRYSFEKLIGVLR